MFNLMNVLHKTGNYAIFLVTGRNSICSQETLDWLQKYNGKYDELFMRKRGDYRQDVTVKEEWLSSLPPLVCNNISMTFEDRKSVVDMWRKHGIQCCQVREGDF